VLIGIRTEIADVLGNRIPTLDDIKKMPYTARVFSEILRLYPPIWTMSRESLGEDSVPLNDGRRVPIRPKTTIMMCYYAVHRREKYWSNPEAFSPERFTPEAIADRPKYAWFPFGGGPRVCLGQRFAMIESVLALAMIFQRYDLMLIPGQDIKPELIITLRPDGPVLIKLKKLERSSVDNVVKPAAFSEHDQGISACPDHTRLSA
jgi:cytochrome P450